MRHPVIGVGLALVLAGCTSVGPDTVRPSTSVTAVPVTAPSRCHAVAHGGGTVTAADVLPDPGCDPGAVNPGVTQQNLAATICKSGWTSTVRPSSGYTNRLKKQDIAAYGDYGGATLKGYEEDHRVPLEVGGAPADPRNLWPEVGNIPNPKDRIENFTHREVCAGRMTLKAAEAVFLGDYWTWATDHLPAGTSASGDGR